MKFITASMLTLAITICLVQGNEIREKRQIILTCSDGTQAVSACYPGGICGLGYRCDFRTFLCCGTTTTVTTGSTACFNNYPAYGSCATTACTTANTYCYNNTCCAACPNTGTIYGSCSLNSTCTTSGTTCINGNCCLLTTTVTTSTNYNNCCINNNICAGVSYGGCSNNYCSNNNFCLNNVCCPRWFGKKYKLIKN